MNNKVTNPKSGLSRRGFLGVAATAGLMLAGCSQDQSSSEQSSDSIEWSGETDVIVMGFGGAGGTAAIEAARQGARVMLFEKAPEEFAGGNSSVCEGGSLIATDRQGAFDAIRRTTTTSSVSDAELNTFLDNNMKTEQWFKEAAGIDIKITSLGDGFDWGSLSLGKGFGLLAQNPTFYVTLVSTVKSNDSIEVFYETPVVDLILDDETNEVRGVTVENSKGEKLNYKALRGVVMACGSFENNNYMIENFCYDPLPELYPLGSPYNTGDGIPMVQKAGARLRHMAELEFGAYCFRIPTQELGATIAVNNKWEDLDHVIAVNKKGLRFMDEAARTQTVANPHPCHEKTTMEELHYDGLNFEYDNLPFWFIFDNDRFTSHALATWSYEGATSGWTTRHNLYSWSEDNQTELDKGWIIKADSIAELADAIGVDAETLEATVAAYNEGCNSGEDPFGRVENLTPIANAPFYATDMTIAFVNANGGPARNENYQVVNAEDEPIPRLFAAGEFGSIWGRDYHGALNVAEALCGFGAGANAAALDPWE